MPSRSGYQRWRDGWLLLGRQDRQGLRVIALECWLGHVPFKRYRGAWSSLDMESQKVGGRVLATMGAYAA